MFELLLFKIIRRSFKIYEKCIQILWNVSLLLRKDRLVFTILFYNKYANYFLQPISSKLFNIFLLFPKSHWNLTKFSLILFFCPHGASNSLLDCFFRTLLKHIQCIIYNIICFYALIYIYFVHWISTFLMQPMVIFYRCKVLEPKSCINKESTEYYENAAAH